MKNISFVKNMLNIIFILILCFLGTLLLNYYNNKFAMTYKPNISLLTVINFIFFGGVGVILGLNIFVVNLKKIGKWKINKIQLLVMGLPSFLISTGNLTYFYRLFSNIEFLSFLYNSNVIIVFNIILGYTIITSLYKD